MTTSKGKRSKTRKKLRKKVREKGKISTQKVIQNFPIGSKAAIKINPSVTEGQPHPKFHGKTGVISSKQGKAYVVDIREGNKKKKVISRPEHLEKVED